VTVVVFDLDGVIVDSEQVWDAVREELAHERGGDWHPGAQRDMMGMSSPEWSRYMHDRIGLTEPPGEINRVVVERMPLWESSTATQSAGSAPIRRAASR